MTPTLRVPNRIASPNAGIAVPGSSALLRVHPRPSHLSRGVQTAAVAVGAPQTFYNPLGHCELIRGEFGTRFSVSGANLARHLVDSHPGILNRVPEPGTCEPAPTDALQSS